MKIPILTVVAVLYLLGSACSNTPSPTVETAYGPAKESPSPIPAAPPKEKLPCPIKLRQPRMVHNLEEDVYATIVNVSDADITAIAFGAAHTDKFGKTWTPYKTDLTSEDTIRRGHSLSMHWELLMEEPSTIAGRRPGSSELYVTKVAFADGRILDSSDIDGCSFTF